MIREKAGCLLSASSSSSSSACLLRVKTGNVLCKDRKLSREQEVKPEQEAETLCFCVNQTREDLIVFIRSKQFPRSLDFGVGSHPPPSLFLSLFFLHFSFLSSSSVVSVVA